MPVRRKRTLWGSLKYKFSGSFNGRTEKIKTLKVPSHHGSLDSMEDHGKKKATVANVHLVVVEATGLKMVDKKGSNDPYCVLGLVQHESSNSDINREQWSQGSPRSSPLLSRKNKQPSLECSDAYKTQTIKGSLSPKWNEEFTLPVHDLSQEELHVYLWNHEDGKNCCSGGTACHKKTSGFKNFLKTLKQNLENSHDLDGLMGMVAVPLKELSTTPIDRWYDLKKQGDMHSSQYGRLRLQLHLIPTQREVDQCSIEEYYEVVEKMYNHAAEYKNDEDLVELSTATKKILGKFAERNNISHLTQALIELVLYLEWTTSREKPSFTDRQISGALISMEQALIQLRPIGVVCTETELSMFTKACQAFTQQYVQSLTPLPQLFPPNTANFEQLAAKISIILRLIHLKLDSHGSAFTPLKDCIVAQIQSDVKMWIEAAEDEIKPDQMDKVIPETASLIEVIERACTLSIPTTAHRDFFLSMNIDYFKYLSLAMDRNFSSKAQELMLQMNKYLFRYQKFPDNVNRASKISLKLYLQLKKLHETVKNNCNSRDLFKMSLREYSEWFRDAVIFWLQTFKIECDRRIEKSLEIDRDFVPVTSLVKYSNSSVDVLSCFAKITAEWNQICFGDADSFVMGVTKITDTICDGARRYADKISCILERNGYYDKDTKEFDITDQLCITLNNIEHVRQYLKELPTLLRWKEVVEAVSLKHESDSVGRKTERTLHRLRKTASSDLLMKSDQLLQKIAERMSPDIRRHIAVFIDGDTTETDRKRKGSLGKENLHKGRHPTDPLLQYLDSNLKTLYERLLASIYPHKLATIWRVIVRSIDEDMVDGQHPDYYAQIEKHVDVLLSYFTQSGMQIVDVDGCYSKLRSRLQLNSCSTEEIILQHFQSLSDNAGTPAFESFGHVAMKLGYMEETHGVVTLFVKVISCTHLPGLDRSGLSDPYVTLDLQPRTLFPEVKSQKTRVVMENLNPVYNEIFAFNGISKEMMSKPGACLQMSVMDFDHILADDFAGEILISLSSINPMPINEHVEDQPVLIRYLVRPTGDSEELKVLEARSSWDEAAKKFLAERHDATYNQPERTDQKGNTVSDTESPCLSTIKSNLISFFGGSSKN